MRAPRGGKLPGMGTATIDGPLPAPGMDPEAVMVIRAEGPGYSGPGRVIEVRAGTNAQEEGGTAGASFVTAVVAAELQQNTEQKWSGSCAVYASASAKGTSCCCCCQ